MKKLLRSTKDSTFSPLVATATQNRLFVGAHVLMGGDRNKAVWGYYRVIEPTPGQHRLLTNTRETSLCDITDGWPPELHVVLLVAWCSFWIQNPRQSWGLKTPAKPGTNPRFSLQLGTTWKGKRGTKEQRCSQGSCLACFGRYLLPRRRKHATWLAPKFLPHLFFYERQQLHTFFKKKTFDAGWAPRVRLKGGGTAGPGEGVSPQLPSPWRHIGRRCLLC